MPNAANINRLIAALKAEEIAGHKIHFAMQRWFSDLTVLRTVPEVDLTDGELGTLIATPEDCGTACCLAGAIGLLLGADAIGALLNDHGIVEYAEGRNHLVPLGMQFLDINADDALELFIPSGLDLDSLTRPEAIRTLENLRDFGTVNWQHACRQLDKLEPMDRPPSHGLYEDPDFAVYEPDEMDEDGRHMIDGPED